LWEIDAVTALVLNLKPFVVSDDEFTDLCRANPDLRFERSSTGEVIAMPPAGSETGYRNAGISGQLWLWNEQSNLGYAFDSSAGFKLPNGAIRSPDASWIVRERWDGLSKELRRGFAPICPDFVVELVSPADDLEMVQAKMREYLVNGARLAWLIDPENRQVEIYQPGGGVAMLDNPTTVPAGSTLPGFVLDLSRIFI
jgi:Uma2 family endonuclease